MLVDQFHCNRAFTNSSRHAFDRTMAYIPGGEDSRHAGLQVERITLWLPPRGTPALIHQVLPGEDETHPVAFHDIRYKVRAGHGADEYEQCGNLPGFCFACAAVREGD